MTGVAERYTLTNGMQLTCVTGRLRRHKRLCRCTGLPSTESALAEQRELRVFNLGPRRPHPWKVVDNGTNRHTKIGQFSSAVMGGQCLCLQPSGRSVVASLGAMRPARRSTRKVPYGCFARPANLEIPKMHNTKFTKYIFLTSNSISEG
jgi:hypothetical protein